MWDSVRLSTHFESAWSHLIISTVHSWFRPHKSRVFVHRKRINLKTPATWIMDAWYADKCENRDNATTRVLSVLILMALVDQLWALFRALWLRRRCQRFQNRFRVHVWTPKAIQKVRNVHADGALVWKIKWIGQTEALGSRLNHAVVYGVRLLGAYPYILFFTDLEKIDFKRNQ